MITSLDNKKVKEVCTLDSKKYRDKLGIFKVETEHLLNEALKNNLLIYSFGTSLYNYPNYEMVSLNVLKKMSSLSSPTVIGVCKKIPEKDITGNILILDNIQDPGNMGTIIRSACAFNVGTIIISNDSVDMYNDKVIRSSEGMIFNINILYRNLNEIIPTLKELGYHIYGTKVSGGTPLKSITKYDKYAIIMGNEGNGIKKETMDLCDLFIYIPMNDKCESLNVSVSTGIILYEFMR